MRFPVVLFDLDGTVVDSGKIILASFRHATRTVLGRELPDEILMRGVGGSSLLEQMRVLDAERAEELADVYRVRNQALHAELEPCPGVPEALARLKAEGRRLGIVTAKRREVAALSLSRLPANGVTFDVVVGADETALHKPHPEPILFALEALGTAPEQAAYVGDSPFDVGAAKAAGTFAVAVTWGGMHPLEATLAEGPDAVVSTAQELLDVL